mmetsp:Transcript_11310/g.41933  ORF Transcript_11310/g.41933 Transcript_11310/m.41933 type:complete len:251 (+) Transcript_11310:696-1448(+)
MLRSAARNEMVTGRQIHLRREKMCRPVFLQCRRTPGLYVPPALFLLLQIVHVVLHDFHKVRDAHAGHQIEQLHGGLSRADLHGAVFKNLQNRGFVEPVAVRGDAVAHDTRQRCGVLRVLQKQVPAVDVHVHVAPQVLRELGYPEIAAAPRDRVGQIQPPLHERVRPGAAQKRWALFPGRVKDHRAGSRGGASRRSGVTHCGGGDAREDRRHDARPVRVRSEKDVMSWRALAICSLGEAKTEIFPFRIASR